MGMDDITNARLSEHLKILRTSKGMNSEEIAKQIGKDRSCVSRAESPNYSTTAANFDEIAMLMGCHLDFVDDSGHVPDCITGEYRQDSGIRPERLIRAIAAMAGLTVEIK